MFDITNSAQFYEKLVFEYEELRKDKGSARVGINCAITAYHLAEWAWGDFVKADKALQNDLGFGNVDEFKAWLDKEIPEFQSMQMIANGTKHFIRKYFPQTNRAEAAFSDAFQQDAFQTQDMLTVEVPYESGPSWMDLEGVIENQILFWRGFIEKYSEHKGLMLPPSRVAEFES